jgi:hypothetical protein
VIEREAVELDVVDCKDGFYQLKNLVSGVAWPSDVDPSTREQYLNPVEFKKTFGITKVGILFHFLCHPWCVCVTCAYIY